VQQDELDYSVVLPEPAPGGGNWQRVIQAEPGYTLADVTLGEVKGARVKNLQAVISADGKTLTLTGAWDAAETGRPAGATPATLDLTLVRESTTAVRLSPVTASTWCGGWGSGAQARLALPPPPKNLRQPKRQIDVEIRLTLDTEGRSRLLLSARDVALPWGSGSLMLGKDYGMAFGAEQDGDHVRVRWLHLFR
jgi:hypothetical protein